MITKRAEQCRAASAKSAAVRSKTAAELARLTRELLSKTVDELRAQGHSEAERMALSLVAAAQGSTEAEVAARISAASSPKSKRRTLRGADDDDLSADFLSTVARVREKNRQLSVHLGRLRRTAEHYTLEASLARKQDVLIALLQVAEHMGSLLSRLRPYAICPQCDGEGGDDCLCRGQWWVCKHDYWEFRKNHDPLPEPSTPDLLGEP